MKNKTEEIIERWMPLLACLVPLKKEKYKIAAEMFESIQTNLDKKGKGGGARILPFFRRILGETKIFSFDENINDIFEVIDLSKLKIHRSDFMFGMDMNNEIINIMVINCKELLGTENISFGPKLVYYEGRKIFINARNKTNNENTVKIL